jgi:hypothetical protein
VRLDRTLPGLALLALLSLYAEFARAETGIVEDNEAELWFGFGARYELIDELRLGVEQQIRLDQNLTRVETLLSDLSLRYTPIRWLRLAVGYRFAVASNDDNEHQLRHRVNVSVGTRHRFRPLILRFRLRYQEEARVEDEEDTEWVHTARFRIEAQVRHVPVIDPFVGIEAFVRIADDDGAFILRKLRGTLGFSFEASVVEVGLAYRLEGDLIERSLAHIILVSWTFDIDP